MNILVTNKHVLFKIRDLLYQKFTEASDFHSFTKKTMRAINNESKCLILYLKISDYG
jgi:hypothetical protein